MNFFRHCLKLYQFYRKKKQAEQRPLVADKPYKLCNIELTNHCPMNCVMCPRTQNMTRKRGYMDFSLFKNVIDQAVLDNSEHTAGKTEIALHHFGESLMHRGFPEFIHYATERGIIVDLSINPLIMTERVISGLINAPPSTLHISLDGHDDHSFFQIRGVRNAYERSKRNFLSYLEAKNTGGIKTRVVLNMIDFSLNKESILKVENLWRTVAGIDEFSIKEFVSWNGDDKVVNLLQGGRKNIIHSPSQKSYVSCNRPWDVLTVTWDGDVVPCCYDYDKKHVLGNVREQSLMEIWRGWNMQDLRRQFISNQVTSPLCVNCEYLLRIF